MYSRLLLSITLCIVVTLVLSSTFYFINYVRLDLKQTYQNDLVSLTENSSEVIHMRESAQTLSFQIYRSYLISKLMFYAKPNIYDVTTAMGELSNYINSIPYIDSIYVYNPAGAAFYVVSANGQNGIFKPNEITDKGIINILQNFKDYKAFTPIPRTYIDTLHENEKRSVYSYLCFDAIGNHQSLNSAVIVNISSDWINKDVSRQAQMGQSFILNDQGKLLNRNGLEATVLSQEDESLLKNRILNQNSNYFVDEFQGHKSLISFTSADSLDWQYIRITPYELITSKIASMRNTTITTAAIILIVGLLLSWGASHLIYRPIQHMLKQMKALESDKRNHSYTLRQHLLKEWLQGISSPTSKAQMQRALSLGVSIPLTAPYGMILLKIDHFASLKQERLQDLVVYKFAIMNISSEICSKAFEVESVDMQQDDIVLILSTNEKPEALLDDHMELLAEQIQAASLEYLRISLSATYYPISNDYTELSDLYSQVKEASLHRLFYGHGSRINSREIATLKTKQYHYPKEKEKKLIEALMSLKIEDATELLHHIVLEMKENNYSKTSQALTRLSMAIHNSITTILKNNMLDETVSVQIPRLEDCETIEQFISPHITLFEHIQHALSHRRSTKQTHLVEDINLLIEEHYSDPELCLNMIADKFQLSPIYISRLYKQHTQQTIIDVINKIRLDHAKQYLIQSNAAITGIAEQCGYTSSSYFHRIFKKNFGVTPAEYRKSYSKIS
jgi:YesN/AraC family two-component response regulator